jgi:hypothetical protein
MGDQTGSDGNGQADNWIEQEINRTNRTRYFVDVAYGKGAMKSGKEFYIIWNPNSPRPPVVTFSTEKAAIEAAQKMAQRFTKAEFYVCKAVKAAKAETPITVRALAKGTR